jgi:hypothetical protein
VTIALAVAAASALACSQAPASGLLFDARLIGPPLALAALAAGTNRPPRCWLWIPGAFLIVGLPALFASAAGRLWPLVLTLSLAAFFGSLGIALLWLVTDARPAIAFGLYLEVLYVLNILAIAPLLGGAVLTAEQGLIIALIAAAVAGAALRVRPRAST